MKLKTMKERKKRLDKLAGFTSVSLAKFFEENKLAFGTNA